MLTEAALTFRLTKLNLAKRFHFVKISNLSVVKEAVEVNNFVPEYLTFDAEKLEGSLTRLPERSELPAEINEALIVEFYSR
ncbi:hypothetical protein PO124_09790 [Bacillus licheniformis]|nr:hypothetical protein [Bacillus licheniformis]